MLTFAQQLVKKRKEEMITSMSEKADADLLLKKKRKGREYYNLE